MLGADTYHRLVSGLVMPQYVLYTLVTASSYILLVLVRWRRTGKVTSSDSGTASAQPRVLTRSDSKATMYHSGAEARSSEAMSSDEAMSGNWFLDSLASRPDLCYHVAQSVALGILAASTLRMKCFWCPYICVLSSVAIADTTLWSSLVSRVSGGHNRATVNLVRHIALACLIIVLFSKHKPE